MAKIVWGLILVTLFAATVSFIWGWQVALVGLLVSGCIVFPASCIIPVPARKSLVVFDYLDSLSRVYMGPCWGLVLPGLESSQLIDSSPKMAEFEVPAHARSQTPVTLHFSLIYQVDPRTIPADIANDVIPFLGYAKEIIRRQVDHIGRGLVANYDLATLFDPRCRARIERQFTATLQDQVWFVGLRLIGQTLLRALTLPPALQTELTEARQRQARAQGLREIEALGGDQEINRILDIEWINAFRQNGASGNWIFSAPAPASPQPSGLARALLGVVPWLQARQSVGVDAEAEAS